MTARASARGVDMGSVRVVAPYVVSAAAMGQQIAERQLLEAISKRDDVVLTSVGVTSLRSPLAADRRIPAGLLLRAPLTVQKNATRWTYRGGDLVHRLDLRL